MEIKIDSSLLGRLHEMLGSPAYAAVRRSLLEVSYGANLKGTQWAPNLWKNPETSLLTTYAERDVDMAGWAADAQINTDRNLRLQYLAGMSVNSLFCSE